MAVVEALEVSVESPDDLESDFRELCDHWSDRRVELVNGRIVVTPVPTGAHNRIVYLLLVQLLGAVQERGWQIWNDITIFLGPQLERYRPDLTVVPRQPKMWGADHVYADQTLLVVEVVSPSSVTDDHDIKPRKYAAAGVPLCLVVDPFGKKVRLLSEPAEKGYEKETDVVVGRPIELPEPWELTLDTAELIG
jgi:Uma2 family endonuclease